mgnify:CR=1 FL=1
MSEFRTIRELCSVVVDCPHSTPKWTANGKIVIRNNNIKHGRIDFSSPSYTDDEHFAQRIKRAKPQPGDIIITREAPIGDVGMIPENTECCLGQRMVLLRANQSVCDNFYLLYSLQSLYVQHQISWSEGTGTTVSNLRIPHLEQIQIPYLPLEQQAKISSVLRALEEKIENNRRLNDNLADLLQTIYQERFGNDILAVNQGVLSDICSYSRDKVAVSELNVITYFSTENMLSGKAGSTEATSLPTTSQTTACHKGDTLISNIRPYFKKIVYCEDKCGCSTDVLCFTPSQPCYSAYLFSTLYADKFFAFMVAGSKGTKMPRGDKQQIMTYPVVLPSEEELAGFNTIASPLLEQIYSNRAENKRLSILRDTLLPKLMSGEINVSAVQL